MWSSPIGSCPILPKLWADTLCHRSFTRLLCQNHGAHSDWLAHKVRYPRELFGFQWACTDRGIKLLPLPAVEGAFFVPSPYRPHGSRFYNLTSKFFWFFLSFWRYSVASMTSARRSPAESDFQITAFRLSLCSLWEVGGFFVISQVSQTVPSNHLPMRFQEYRMTSQVYVLHQRLPCIGRIYVWSWIQPSRKGNKKTLYIFMPGGTWLYSACCILFWCVAVRLGFRIHLHIAACSPHKFECYLWNCYTAFHVAEHI